MNPYLKELLIEMFRIVGASFTEEFIQAPGWYVKYSWSQEEEFSFKEWATRHLYKSKEARQALMAFPRKNKALIAKTIDEFIFNYGWKDKDE